MQWVGTVCFVAGAFIAALLLIAAVDGTRAGKRVVVRSGAGMEHAEGLAQGWAEEADNYEVLGTQITSPIDHEASSSAKQRDHDLALRRLGVAAAGTDGALIGAHAWLSIDPAVFEAAAQAAHAPIDNLLDLASVAHLETWANATAGMQASLAGHVGEFLAQGHLADAGLTAHMAQLSNQQGWDAAIGDLHVNFKDYADFHSPGIAAHFASNPDVPVVMPIDTAHLPSDALHISPGQHLDPSQLAEHKVIVLDAWHHADAAAAMQHAYDQLDPSIAIHHALDAAAAGDVLGAAGALDIGFPIVTAVLAGFREGRLLFDGDTDVIRAAKNAALDVGGVAGGGAAGHLAGAGLGMMVAGPPGAVVGGVIGGIAAAIGGKLVAGQVRAQPLRQAVEEFEGAQQKLISVAKTVEHDAKSAWDLTYREADDEYGRAVAELVAMYDGFAAQQRLAAEQASSFNPTSATAALARARLSTDEDDALAGPSKGWRSLPVIANVRRFAALIQLRRDLVRWDRVAATAGSTGDRELVLDALAALPSGSREIEIFTAVGVTTRASVYQALSDAALQTQSAAINLRLAAQEHLDNEWTVLQSEIKGRLEKPRKRWKKAAARLNKELRAAGRPAIDFDPDEEAEG